MGAANGAEAPRDVHAVFSVGAASDMRAVPGAGTGSGAALVWSDEFLEYNFGATHPMDPRRLALTIALIRELGIELETLPAVVASEELLTLVHDPGYVEAVKESSARGQALAAGLTGSDGDNPVFGAMHEASARIVGGTVRAVRAVMRGQFARVFAPAGGMHHAHPDRAEGFCVYNDAAVAIASARAAGCGPVVYVDLDVHHGDGVQAAFEGDDDVTTVSVHQHPRRLFPHTGYPSDVGADGGKGHAINVALPEDVTDGGWLRAIEAIVEPVLREVRPALLVTQHGADTHRDDPLAELRISIEAQREAALMMREYADEYSSGKWVALGGGGYDVDGAVPIAWAHVAAVVAGREIDPGRAVPRAWRELVGATAGETVREIMGDFGPQFYAGRPAGTSGVVVRSFHEGYDPASDVDRAILATRTAAFPLLGLDPYAA